MKITVNLPGGSGEDGLDAGFFGLEQEERLAARMLPVAETVNVYARLSLFSAPLLPERGEGWDEGSERKEALIV